MSGLNIASAQTPSYLPVKLETLQSIAQSLRQDLTEGSLRVADLHALQLRLAIVGVLREETDSKIRDMESPRETDKKQPKLTENLVPLDDKLLQELYEGNLDGAKKDAETLVAKVDKLYGQDLRQQVESPNSGDAEYDKYLKLTKFLRDSLMNGDIAKAVVVAAEVQSAENKLTAKGLNPLMHDANVYDINDALGRAAFLRQDYDAACDYLLKAAETEGKFSTLTSFGPDVWLARGLLRKGYKDVVVTFLERCKLFWPNSKIDEWVSEINSGETPNFSHSIRSDEPILLQ